MYVSLCSGPAGIIVGTTTFFLLGRTLGIVIFTVSAIKYCSFGKMSKYSSSNGSMVTLAAWTNPARSMKYPSASDAAFCIIWLTC